jgi:hypothetical protein
MNNETAAREMVAKGDLVAMIVIPQGFSEGINEGKTMPITVFIDNINTDLTDDIQRAVPSAIMSFGDALKFEGVNASVVETDTYAHDTSFINYMIASALVLDALIIAGTLSALSVAEEFESKSAKLLAHFARSPTCSTDGTGRGNCFSFSRGFGDYSHRSPRRLRYFARSPS